MKILAYIPVEKVQLPMGYWTFRTEVLEVDVVRVLRYASSGNRALNRWKYHADVKHPAMVADEAYRDADGCIRVNIFRAGLNPRWKAPVFPAGKDWLTMGDEA